jgi:hypothetical protein
MAKKRVDALSIKAGPTESGVVGGEIMPVDTLTLLLSHTWVLVLLFLLPLGVLLYKKRDAISHRFLKRLR